MIYAENVRQRLDRSIWAWRVVRDRCETEIARRYAARCLAILQGVRADLLGEELAEEAGVHVAPVPKGLVTIAWPGDPPSADRP